MRLLLGFAVLVAGCGRQAPVTAAPPANSGVPGVSESAPPASGGEPTSAPSASPIPGSPASLEPPAEPPVASPGKPNCTVDSDCLVTTFGGCCDCCGCTPVYGTTPAEAQAGTARCWSVKCGCEADDCAVCNVPDWKQIHANFNAVCKNQRCTAVPKTGTSASAGMYPKASVSTVAAYPY